MKSDDFWSLIRHSRDGLAEADDGAALVGLTSALAELNEQDIMAFDERFREEVAGLDRADLRDVANQLWVLSEEDWRNFRAWCVSQGPVFIERLRSQTGALRDVAVVSGGPFDAPSGELFLYSADYARVTREVSVAT